MNKNNRLVAIGKALERLIEQKGLSLGEAAVRCEVLPCIITRWIQGWNMTLETVMRIEECLDIELLNPDVFGQHPGLKIELKATRKKIKEIGIDLASLPLAFNTQAGFKKLLKEFDELITSEIKDMTR